MSCWRFFVKNLTDIRLFEAVSANTLARHTCTALASLLAPHAVRVVLADPTDAKANLAISVWHAGCAMVDSHEET